LKDFIDYYGEQDRYDVRVSDVYKKLKLSKVTLTKIIRQNDPEFIKKLRDVKTK
jgi:hypothetical protein